MEPQGASARPRAFGPAGESSSPPPDGREVSPGLFASRGGGPPDPGTPQVQDVTSLDGVTWAKPTLTMKNAYAPCVIKEGDKYRMWYTCIDKHP